ncbi:nucleoside 2-deoxyribosyltransferase [Pedobacter nototheniae]|uniref:nucleoside 2-deoxyribosyltransferase n=1 Tax=Pedobacter nototheniae TaxID=2488994 RepID=UPI00103FAE3D|nr:nucleoside 2-deoxyribosyltransferase [Pedobacter nototheniae]
MTTNRVYISGALMAAKNLDRVKKLYNDIAMICDENGLQSYLPHNNTDPIKNSEISDIDVYQKDFEELIKSSLVISYIGEPSLGVGAELSICIANQIPIIAITESKRKVSRFLKGMLQATDNAFSIEFDNKDDLVSKLNLCLRSLSQTS